MGEAELIARIRAAARALGADRGRGLVLGIGDDAALIRSPGPREDLALTVDDQVEGVHFRRRWASPRDIGRKAAGAALSDLAAMGARPLAALLALETPPRWTDAELALVARGLCEVLAAHGCPLAGGNVAARPPREGLSLSVSFLGAAPRGRALRRDGGRPGDVLLVSGAPGLARAGLLALETGRAARGPLAAAARKLLRPEPRLALGRALVALPRARAPRAVLDLSDGLARDLPRLARASGCEAVVEAARLPIGKTLRAAARALGRDPVDLVLEGGEDYELLIACPPRAVSYVVRAAGPLALAPIGRLVAGRPGRVAVLPEGGRRRPLGRGFDHRS